MILVGELSLWIALLMAAWCATVSIAGGIAGRRDLARSGERAAHAAFAFIALACLGLWRALLTRDFSLAYVGDRISANMPDVYVFAAFWSGPEGATLLWALVLAGCTAVAVWSNRLPPGATMPFVTGALGLVLTFLLATVALAANPYERVEWPALDGRGMHPQLQHPGMLMHPLALCLGYATTAIPFAFAVAALATRRRDAGWLPTVRSWTLAGWFFITAGIVLGMWWAYVEIGRSGSWAWEPVRNFSILPWLTGTAFLYSVMHRERGGMLGKAALGLVIATFLLACLGAFTMTGGIEGIGNAVASPVGSWFVLFLVGATAVATWLLTTRVAALESVSEPHGRAGDGRLVPRPGRRYGWYLASAGAVMLFAAITGFAFRREYDVSLTAGQPFDATDPYGRTWRFVSQGISTSESLNREITAVALEASLDGRAAGLIGSEKRQYFDSQRRPTFEPSTEVGIREGALQDVYVVLTGIRDGAAELRIAFNPLVAWAWVGGAMIAVGGLLVMRPPVARASSEEHARVDAATGGSA